MGHVASEAHVSDPSRPLQFIVTPIKKTGPGTLGGYAPFLSVSKQRTVVPRRTREAIGRYYTRDPRRSVTLWRPLHSSDGSDGRSRRRIPGGGKGLKCTTCTSVQLIEDSQSVCRG